MKPPSSTGGSIGNPSYDEADPMAKHKPTTIDCDPFPALSRGELPLDLSGFDSWMGWFSLVRDGRLQRWNNYGPKTGAALYEPTY